MAGEVKTLRFECPVWETAETEHLLELVTRVHGVVAAVIVAGSAQLDVVLGSCASAMLVKEQVDAALLAGWATVASRTSASARYPSDAASAAEPVDRNVHPLGRRRQSDPA